VNGKAFHKQDVDRGVANALRGQKVDSSVLPTVQATVLKQMIEHYLLSSYLLGNKELAPGPEVNAAMNELRDRARQQGTTLAAQLASQNMNEQALMSQLAWEIMQQKYVTTVMTDEGLKKFFEEKKHLFDGTTRRVSHVLLRPEVGEFDEAALKGLIDQAKTLRGQIQAGQLKFEDAAAKFSDGPSRQRGGDLGYVPISGVMHPAFSKAAYDLQQGDISEPVGTPSGVHLIKVTEIKSGTKTFDDVKKTVQQAYAQSLIEKLKEEQEQAATIEYAGNYPYFKPGTRDVVMPGQSADAR
jgi:parvulin-like peptidyl-prolyl isomerase